MTPAEYLESQSKYKVLSKRQAQLEVQIKLNQRNPEVLSVLRAEYREVTTAISEILINNINQSSNGTN